MHATKQLELREMLLWISRFEPFPSCYLWNFWPFLAFHLSFNFSFCSWNCGLSLFATFDALNNCSFGLARANSWNLVQWVSYGFMTFHAGPKISLTPIAHSDMQNVAEKHLNHFESLKHISYSLNCNAELPPWEQDETPQGTHYSLQDFKTEAGHHFWSKKPRNGSSFRHLGMLLATAFTFAFTSFSACLCLCLCCKWDDPGAEAPKQSLSKSHKVSAGGVTGRHSPAFLHVSISMISRF